MRLRKDLQVLQCDCCEKLMVVTNDEFVELFKQGEITTDEEDFLADILDEILRDECDGCDFNCEECEY